MAASTLKLAHRILKSKSNVSHHSISDGAISCTLEHFSTIIAMSSISYDQVLPWDAIDLLGMINPDINGWSCMGSTRTPALHGRRCRNKILQANISDAKRILAALPSTANDTRALEHRLGKLASLTLCKHPHLRQPGQHTQLIDRWMETIRPAQSSDLMPFPQTPNQSVRQDVQQGQTNQPRHSSELSHQLVAPAFDSCTICLDPVGTNGGGKTLSCSHTYCRGCITRWWSESSSCPLCRDDGSDRVVDPIQPSPQAREREEDEAQRASITSQSSTSPGLVVRASEQAQGLPSVFQQASLVEDRADGETSVTQQVSDVATGVSVAIESSSNRTIPTDCGICLEENGENGGPETLRCSHTFCRNCISQWLLHSSRCPYRCEIDQSAEANIGAPSSQ
jgi:hypothetical protein